MKFLFSEEFSQKALIAYNRVVNFLVIITVPVILLTLLLAIFIILYDLEIFISHLLSEETKLGHDKVFKLLIKDILNFFVLIEIFRVFLDVIEYKRIRKRRILEAGIVFVVREIVIAMFEHRFSYLDLIGYGVLLLAFGITYVIIERSWLEVTKYTRKAEGDQ